MGLAHKEGNAVRMLLGVGLVLMAAASSNAAVSIQVESRTELLYSTDANVDCTKLHMETDGTKLPFNVVRLRALANGAPIDLSTVKVQWSFRGTTFGTFAADLDLGPTGSQPTVTAMCAEFGNECLLTGDRLTQYDRDTIFYVAPTCESLKRDPTKPFGGGGARIRMKATAGRQKLGKADVTIGYGRNGGATLFVRNVANQFSDGLGRGPVSTGVITNYAARIQQPDGMPKAPETFRVSGDLGGTDLDKGPCSDFPADACDLIEQSGDRGTMLLNAIFEDKSAICDNISVVIANCSAAGVLDVTPKPKRTTYDPANPSQNLVDLSVRLRNTSRSEGGLPPCNFFLQGNIASCSSTVKVGGFTETKTTSFALPHCSKTTDRDCSVDSQCRPPACTSCDPAEICLVKPYCSTTVTQLCTHDDDCAPPACPTCVQDEICVHMLDFPAGEPPIFILPQSSLELVTGTAAMRNRFKSTAAVTDTWTVNVKIPALTFTKTLKYKIRGRP
jgi:hypothetical protein